MTDTLFLLGAGFSRAAGIPLLGDFVQRMMELSNKRGPRKSGDNSALVKALEIRAELDQYHGRASFDDRNIEDILSILTFNCLAGGRKDREKLDIMTQAIARTIEATCMVTHPGIDPSGAIVNREGPEMYRAFWKSLFASCVKGRQFPSIITFNYDLVLERSLLQVLIGTEFSYSHRLPFDQIRLNYEYEHFPVQSYSVKYANYDSYSERGPSSTAGTVLRDADPVAGRVQTIEILKLHGSVNFPLPTTKKKSGGNKRQNIAEHLSHPYILPPVFNKMSNKAASSAWIKAIERVRQARNIVIVGYSLPQTDIYMQYFLKAAVGPNRDLDKIVVYDPVLFSDSDACAAMKLRYASCFSEQLRRRIVYNPETHSHSLQSGTAESFVGALANNPDYLLF